MKKSNFILLVILMLFITGCSTIGAKDIHGIAKERVISKYAPDVVEYLAPAGDSWGSSDHQFLMSSKNLGKSFHVYVTDYRDNPKYYDSYLSVKYADKAEIRYLSDLENYIINIGILGDKYRVKSTSFDSVLNDMDMSANISFEDWYNSISDWVVVTIIAEIENPEGYNFEEVSEYILKYVKNRTFENTLCIIWVNNTGYNLEDDSTAQDLMSLYGGFYAKAWFNKNGVEWENSAEDGFTKRQSELYVESDERVESLLKQHIFREEWIMEQDEKDREREERIENGELFEITDEIPQIEGKVEMPSSEELEEKLVQGNKILEETTFDHLKDTWN